MGENSLRPLARLAAVACLIFTTAATSRSQIIINEILPAPNGQQQEFIELYNTSGSPVELASVFVRDRRSDWLPVAPIGAIEPGAFLVVVPDRGAGWPNTGVISMSRWASLNNSGDSLVVAVGETVTDRLGYTSDQVERGRSLERVNPGIPGTLEQNWRQSVDAAGATPGAVNSVFSVDKEPPEMLGVETDGPDGLLIWFSEAIDPASAAGAAFELDGRPVTVQPDFLGSRIRLSIALNSEDRTLRVAGLRDYAGHPIIPGAVRIARPARKGELTLTELLVEPGSGIDDLPEFVEMSATSAHPVSLRRATLSIGGGPEPDAIALARSDSTMIIEPGGIMIVYASPATGPTARHLLERMQTAVAASGGNAILLAASPSKAALRNAGDLVQILNANASVTDAVRYTSAMNDRRYRSHRRRSIHRIRADPGISDLLRWASTTGPTPVSPGAVTDLSTPLVPFPAEQQVVISEIMPRPLADPFDGVADQMEYIEIANRSDQPVDLNGLRLGEAPDERDFGNDERIVFQSSVLDPGKVALIFEIPTGTPDRDSQIERRFEEAFPTARSRAELIIPTRIDLALADDKDTIRLLSPCTPAARTQDPCLDRIDHVQIAGLTYTSSMHHPAIHDPTGIALERTVLSRTPLRLGAWGSSIAPGGGTPGYLSPSPGPPPPSSDTPVLSVTPRSITPDGDGFDDRVVVQVAGLRPASLVRAEVFNLDGRLIRTLTASVLTEDRFTVEWRGLDDLFRPVPRGFYVILVRIAESESSRTVSLKHPVSVLR